MRNAPDLRIAAAARGFVLLALGGPILWGRDVSSVIALAALGTGWLLALNLELRAPRLRVPLVVLDAGFVGLVAGTELTSQAVLGALAVPPFIAGLWQGLRGVLLALSAELIAVVVVGIASGGPLSADQSFAIFTWAAMGLALGMVATFVRGALRDDDPMAPYRHASDLLRELNQLSVGLSSGLEPRSLGGVILSTVLDEVPASAVSIHVPLDDHLATLTAKSLPGGDLDRCADFATAAWARDQVVVEDGIFAFPLEGHRSTVAVVSGSLPPGSSVGPDELRHRVTRLQVALEEQAVQLETGLLFEAFRDTATADERQRLGAGQGGGGLEQQSAELGGGGPVGEVDAAGPGDGRPERAHRGGHRHVAAAPGPQGAEQRVLDERQVAGDGLDQHEGEGVHVGAAVQRLALGLLGRGEAGGADDALDEDVGAGGLGQRPGQAEVGDLEVAVLAEQQVGRLEVAVHDPHLVGVVERLAHLEADDERLGV